MGMVDAISHLFIHCLISQAHERGSLEAPCTMAGTRRESTIPRRGHRTTIVFAKHQYSIIASDGMDMDGI
jgi:hypothetical protein